MDISLCANDLKCKKRKKCLRSTAKPMTLRQSYSNFYKEGMECEYYIDDKKNRKRRMV